MFIQTRLTKLATYLSGAPKSPHSVIFRRFLYKQPHSKLRNASFFGIAAKYFTAFWQSRLFSEFIVKNEKINIIWYKKPLYIHFFTVSDWKDLRISVRFQMCAKIVRLHKPEKRKFDKMQNTPKGLRLQIGVFGKRNAGKSSILNVLARQKVSIVSDTPGTTTDPVEKAMEMLPLGPVLFIDTAGLDDCGELGIMRIERSRKMIERTDLAIIVSAEGGWESLEETLLEEFRTRKVPVIIVFNKSDLALPPAALTERLDEEKIPHVTVSAARNEGFDILRQLIIKLAPEDFMSSARMLGGLVRPGKSCVLVTPIDLEAPKGRMILPQVQAIRDTLDSDAYCIVVKEDALAAALANLKTDPDLVVTDSQAFANVSKLTPQHLKLTSFSILMARMKGDLSTCAAGAAAIDKLKPGSKVLIAEACTHHPIGEDIGTVKIPAWLKNKAGGELDITHVQGHDFPKDPSGYELVIHCGACTFNRRELLSRIEICRERQVPFTNYGVAIAHCVGILERALLPFPGIYAAYKNEKKAETEHHAQFRNI